MLLESEFSLEKLLRKYVKSVMFKRVMGSVKVLKIYIFIVHVKLHVNKLRLVYKMTDHVNVSSKLKFGFTNKSLSP